MVELSQLATARKSACGEKARLDTESVGGLMSSTSLSFDVVVEDIVLVLKNDIACAP